MAKLSVDAPACRFCGAKHWTYEAHVNVTKSGGTRGEVLPRPAQSPPEGRWDSEGPARAQEESEAPATVTKIGRGRPKRYENAAARQKAYRERHGN